MNIFSLGLWLIFLCSSGKKETYFNLGLLCVWRRRCWCIRFSVLGDNGVEFWWQGKGHVFIAEFY